MLHRAASAVPSTLDREGRTVQAVVLSGLAPVLRAGPDPDGYPGPWFEELDAAGADLSRFRAGPVLKDHRPTTDAQVGAVDSAVIEGDKIIATLRFSTKPSADEVFQDVASGVLKGVSLGYSVQQWSRQPDRDGKRVFRATKWIPAELSLTPLPADAGATVRNQPMTESTTTAPPAAQNRAEINQQIRSIARTAGLDAAFADRQIDAGATAEQARAAAWEAMVSRQAMQPTVSTVHTIVDHTDPAAVRARMADAVAARFTRATMPEQARAFADMSLAQMAGHLANARGASISLTDSTRLVDSLLSRSGMHTTSDFPLLLEDAGNKILMGRYQAAAPSYRRFAAQRPFRNFQPHKFLHVGDFPALQEIPEAGEVKYGTMSEVREQVTAKEYGSAFSISRKALINDDLQAFADFNGAVAVRVAADENRLVYALLASNGPTMSDSTALFDSTHGNKAGTASTIDVANLGIAVAAMYEQTSPDSIKLNIAPRFLVTGSAKMMAAQQVVASITPASVSEVNPFSGALEVVTDANVSSNRWMLFADPALHPVVVYGYVGGAAGPQIRSEIDFDTRALKIAVGLDFACGVIDYRGAYLNSGA